MSPTFSASGSGGGFSESSVQFVLGGATCWISVWEDVALLNIDHCTETRNIAACRKLQIVLAGTVSSHLMIFFYMNVSSVSDIGK